MTRTIQSDNFQWSPDWEADIRATLMFIVRDGKVLLIRKKRGIGAGKVNGPGGKFEPGETAQECIIREVKEELEIDVHDAKQMAELHFGFQCGTIPQIHCQVFTATAYSGTPTETAEALPFWVDINDIPYHEMWADDILWLPEMLNGHHIQAYFSFHKDTLLAHKIDID